MHRLRSSLDPIVLGAQFNLICAPRPMIVEESNQADQRIVSAARCHQRSFAM
jgi:hypothetical protein